jgi:hypothetical protein
MVCMLYRLLTIKLNVTLSMAYLLFAVYLTTLTVNQTTEFNDWIKVSNETGVVAA